MVLLPGRCRRSVQTLGSLVRFLWLGRLIHPHKFKKKNRRRRRKTRAGEVNSREGWACAHGQELPKPRGFVLGASRALTISEATKALNRARQVRPAVFARVPQPLHSGESSRKPWRSARSRSRGVPSSPPPPPPSVWSLPTQRWHGNTLPTREGSANYRSF